MPPSPATPSEHARTLLQERVAAFGILLGVLYGVGAISDVVTFFFDSELGLGHVVGWMLGALIFVLGMWMRRGQKSEVVSRRIEELMLVLISIGVLYNAPQIERGALAAELGGPVIPDAALPAFGQLLHAYVFISLVAGTSSCVLLRAGIIPSSSRRTALLTLLAGMPLILSPALGIFDLISPFDIPAAPRATVVITISTSVWWFITTAVATATSHVINGLHAEVRAAQKLGQYTLEAKIGEGGMGMVFRAQHALLRRPTAIKLIQPDKAGQQGLARFEREVRLTARLSHPNTVTIYDYGHTPDGVFYYAMELLDGATLAQIVEATGPMPPARVLHVLHGIAGALAEAHDVGLIHRDVKPANIFLARIGGQHDVPKILDFGLVKEIDAKDSAIVTQESSVTGTPLYMAPEALTDPDTIDGRADLYALGCVGNFLLTGEHVFSGNNVVEILGHHLHSAPQSPSERLGKDLPHDIEELILECLRKEPSDRPEDARALAEKIEACAAYGDWMVRDRQAWWAAHGGEIVRDEITESPSDTRTLAIALATTR